MSPFPTSKGRLRKCKNSQFSPIFRDEENESTTLTLTQGSFAFLFAICDVKSKIDPCLSHHGRGSKLLLVLITLQIKKRNFEARFVKYVFFRWGDQYRILKISELRCTLNYLLLLF